MKTFADKIIDFNKKLSFEEVLPQGISIMNPFRENEQSLIISSEFYKKYYNDHQQRHLILGINPGRFGAGITGIPFTDTKRLMEVCGIDFTGKNTHEPSSAFIYEMIDSYGGAEKFYQHFYIHSVCPLGFTKTKEAGKEVNYNYYDSKELIASVYDFMIWNISTQIKWGINREVAFCFGTGKNEKFLNKINEEYQFFKRIISLEHPRFIMQYKAKSKKFYIDKYLAAFDEVRNQL